VRQGPDQQGLVQELEAEIGFKLVEFSHELPTALNAIR
jgi:hypothetical protein